MGDLRRIRNWIIHRDSIVPSDVGAKLPFITQIWNIEPGALWIAPDMIHLLMEQLNAMQVKIETSESECDIDNI